MKKIFSFNKNKKMSLSSDISVTVKPFKISRKLRRKLKEIGISYNKTFTEKSK